MLENGKLRLCALMMAAEEYVSCFMGDHWLSFPDTMGELSRVQMVADTNRSQQYCCFPSRQEVRSALGARKSYVPPYDTVDSLSTY